MRRRVDPGACRLTISNAAFRSAWPSACVAVGLRDLGLRDLGLRDLGLYDQPVAVFHQRRRRAVRPLEGPLILLPP